MKKNLFAACLTLALTLNAVAANAQNSFARDVIRNILVELGTDAAKAIFKAMFSSDPAEPEARNPVFTDNEWLVSIGENGNDLTYYGVNLQTRNSISLRGVTITSNNQREIYTWKNGNYRYQVAWQPQDPGVIRLQVFDGRGKQLLNRLLYQTDS